MKKTIPVLSPFVIGLLGAWFTECLLNFCCIVGSPFAGSEGTRFFVFCGICSLLSGLLILAITIANGFFLIELNSKKKARFVLIAQACVSLSLFAVSLNFADKILSNVTQAMF